MGFRMCVATRPPATGTGVRATQSRALMSDGMRLEETQVDAAVRLFKLAVVGLAAACRTIQLVDARDGSPRPAIDVIEVIDPTRCPPTKPLVRHCKAKPNARKTPIRSILLHGCLGSSRDLEGGIATTNHLDRRR